MSKITREIKLFKGFNKKASLGKLGLIELESVFNESPVLTECYLDLCISKTAYINLSDRELEHFATEQLKKAIIEELYGEFRPKIREIYLSLLEQDFDKSLKFLQELEKEMYD